MEALLKDGTQAQSPEDMYYAFLLNDKAKSYGATKQENFLASRVKEDLLKKLDKTELSVVG